MNQTQLSQLRLSLQQAQLLASLKYQQGLFDASQHYSADWLARLAVLAQQKSAQLLSHCKLDDISFDYSQGQRFAQGLKLSSLATADILALHRQLHPKGGQLRQLNLSQPLRHQPDQQLQISKALANHQQLTQLIDDLRQTIQQGGEPLIAIPLFIYQLLLAFPFLNGNRRVALLLGRQLLIEQGVEVLQYQSLEAQIVGSDPQLYQLLYNCSHLNGSLEDWLCYWWQLFLNCYQRFFKDAQESPIKNYRGGKTQLIKQTIQQMDGAFALTELQQQLPTVGADLIRKVVRECRNQGWLASTGRGRLAKWQVLKN